MKDFQNIKKIGVLLIILVLLPYITQARNIDPPFNEHEYFSFDCDLCSCSTSSGSFGFGTLGNANFIGLRYIYQKFESKKGIFENSPISKETFNTYQLWAQIPISNALYINVSLPYQDLSRKIDNSNEQINGIGDSNLIGWYKLRLYKKQKDSAMVNMGRAASGHALQFGVGIKLPTGKFEESLADNVNPGFQIGTGSVDGIFSLGYNYGSNKLGINTVMTYYVKGENKNDYQFGNQFSYSANFYTAFPREKVNIMPFVGLSGDIYNKITQYGETLNDTDGSITNATLGTEFAFSKCILGINYTLPVNQDLFGGNVESKNRFSLYINYAL
ncbi:hypothetical protein [Flavivirga sp. 57AJ16]|uniref:hypothetical protein n=1 Tax=Flavivirga sp. 57AJ16 TaxID=3025307 RepID=UPI0023667984|nr:hypothetical protein [Flavivirga sp. 57AJ16]MDD7885107.1 hypothetical protein [Flavivirga sp. 57AJ16]